MTLKPTSFSSWEPTNMGGGQLSPEDYPQYQGRGTEFPLGDSSRGQEPFTAINWQQEIGPDSWSTVSTLDNPPVPMRSQSSEANSSTLTFSRFSDDQETCIFAKLLIPGRGKPISDAAVGISQAEGKITFVGKQSDLPKRLQAARQICVGYLLPGLWDCHTHFAGALNVDFPDFIQTHPANLGAAITRGFHDTLMAGFTSVRDVGSYATEVAPLMERGIILGPNVFGAGAAIGITGGSCDCNPLPLDYVYSRQGTNDARQDPWSGVSQLVLADGVDNCRLAVRQQIRRGARCIKIVATGGVLSTTDDPKYRQYSDSELHAMVEEATLQGRSVAIHAHGKDGIMAAIRAGAHTIEHGSYIDEEAADLMAARGVTLVATRNVIEAGLRHLDTLNPPTARKMVQVAEMHKKAYATAVKKNVKIALGTDIAGSDPSSQTSHGKNGPELVWAVQAGLTPLQAIEAATINAAETLGKLRPNKGLIMEGWDADMIAVEHNPLEEIKELADAANIKFVWQGGLLVKSPNSRMLWPPPRTVK